jgi:hypothetical protein
MRLTVGIGGRFEPNHPPGVAIRRHPLSQDLRAHSGAGLLGVRLVMVGQTALEGFELCEDGCHPGVALLLPALTAATATTFAAASPAFATAGAATLAAALALALRYFNEAGGLLRCSGLCKQPHHGLAIESGEKSVVHRVGVFVTSLIGRATAGHAVLVGTTGENEWPAG